MEFYETFFISNVPELQCISSIFEKRVFVIKSLKKLDHDRLYMFLEQNNAFYNYQFGFRNKHSGNHTLTEITELYMFLEQNNAFYNYQFGFRNKHSGNHALTEITEHTRNARDKNLFTCRVYLHLQKSFHTVKHEILLSILKHYGIKELRIIGLSRFSLKECNIL